MKKLLLITMVVFLFSCGGNKENNENSKPYEVNFVKDIPSFSADSIYTQVENQVSFGPRNPNSEAAGKTKKYLVDYLSRFAEKVEVQDFSYTGYDNEKLNLSNIIAKFNVKSDKRIILCAHWDSRPRAEEDKIEANKNKPIPGANDGASGVGVLLEIARILKTKPVDYGIDIILFDGEDYGNQSDLNNFCLGSKYFSTSKPADYNPAFAVLLDLVGDKEARFRKEQLSLEYAADIVEMVWDVAAKTGAKSFLTSTSGGIYDDHIPLNQAGIKAVNIVDAELIGADSDNPRRNYWHTQNDTMENISKETLGEVAKVMLHLIYSLKFN